MAKYMLSTCCCYLVDHLLGLLPLKAQLTWARSHFPVRNGHASHEALIHHVGDGLGVEVAKMVVPKV